MNKTTKILVTGFLIVIFLFTASGGIVYASDSAKPGDLLFPVDKVGEDIQRTFISNDVDRAKFEMDVQDERMQEMGELGQDNENVSNAIAEINQQQAEVQQTLHKVEESPDVTDEVKEQLQNRYEEQVQKHLEKMEQLQTKLEEKGNENAAEALQKAMDNYQTGKENSQKWMNDEKDKNEKDDQKGGKPDEQDDDADTDDNSQDNDLDEVEDVEEKDKGEENANE